MQIIDTALPEVKRIILDIYADNRGFFTERFHTEKFAALGLCENFVQLNHSRSLPGVIRGIHFQHAPMQGKLVGVTRGAIIDVAVDLRPDSPRFLQHAAVELSDENGELLWIPAGFGHGFCVIGEVAADVVYNVTALHSAEGESGVRFDDPQLAIAWPVAHPILSGRDRNLPGIHDARDDLQRWFGSLPKPHALLFDWDNTLVDTWPLIHTALNRTLDFMQHPPWSFEKVRSEVKQSMRDAFPGLFGDAWPKAAEHYQASYRAIHLADLRPLEGAVTLLKSIPDDIFVAVVSNKKGDTLRAELAHLGWEKYFDAAVGAGDAARDKPHGDPVLFALRECGIAPDKHSWFIGDTGVDLACAEAVGCTAILYGDHVTNGAMHDGFAYDAQVRNLIQLQALIAASCAGE
jgi:phosphoglycolate phosphatase